MVTFYARLNPMRNLCKISVAAFGRKPHFPISEVLRRPAGTPLRRKDDLQRFRLSLEPAVKGSGQSKKSVAAGFSRNYSVETTDGHGFTRMKAGNEAGQRYLPNSLSREWILATKGWPLIRVHLCESVV